LILQIRHCLNSKKWDLKTLLTLKRNLTLTIRGCSPYWDHKRDLSFKELEKSFNPDGENAKKDDDEDDDDDNDPNYYIDDMDL
jgi:hypothetical protein